MYVNVWQCLAMLDNATRNGDSIIFQSGMAENAGVDVGIAAPSLAVQK